MNGQGWMTKDIVEVAVPMAFVAVFLAILVVPSVTFGIARKWSLTQPQSAGIAMGGAAVVSIVAILAAATLTLAVVGWLPPLGQLLSPAGASGH